MDKEYMERRLKANELLLKTIKKVDPTSDDTGIYSDIAQLYRELNLDIKMEMESILKEKELEIERLKIENEAKAKEAQIEIDRIKNETEKLRIETEAKTKADAIEFEKERSKVEATKEKHRFYLEWIGRLAVGAATVFSAFVSIWQFKSATKKEEDEALLTQTSQTIVRNGLSGRLFK